MSELTEEEQTEIMCFAHYGIHPDDLRNGPDDGIQTMVDNHLNENKKDGKKERK